MALYTRKFLLRHSPSGQNKLVMWWLQSGPRLAAKLWGLIHGLNQGPSNCENSLLA